MPHVRCRRVGSAIGDRGHVNFMQDRQSYSNQSVSAQRSPSIDVKHVQLRHRQLKTTLKTCKMCHNTLRGSNMLLILISFLRRTIVSPTDGTNTIPDVHYNNSLTAVCVSLKHAPVKFKKRECSET